MPDFRGQKWTQDRKAAARFGLQYVESASLEGLSRQLGLIHQGGNSGYQALNLAIHLGATRILLIGYDMGAAPDGKKHFFGNHPPSMDVESPYAKWVVNYEAAARDAQAMSVEIINCSRRTALECFKRLTIEEALA